MNNVVPIGWKLYELKDVALKTDRHSFTGGPFGSNLKSEDYTDYGVRIIQLQNIGDGEFKNKYKIFTSPEKADELSSCNIFPNDIILSKMGDPVARATIIPSFDNRYVMASDGIRLAVDKSRFDTKFIHDTINAQAFRTQAELSSTGSTRKRIGLTELRSLTLVAPPLPEQQKIATILSSVDDVIEKTRAQIDKLKDLKTGMMQELLTKGIGHTAFKDSPVGRIPADWSVVEIGEIALQVKPGPFGSSLTKAMYVSSGYKVYGQEQVISGDFKVGDYYIDQAKYDELSAFKVSGGDVLISLVGTFGQIAVVPEDFQCGIINPRLLIIRFPLNLVNTEFIAQQLKSDYVLNQLKQLQQGGTMGVLSATTVKPVKLIIPPIEQQRLIGQAMKSVDKSILAKEAQLESTKNTKKALMQDLLTGKVRVNLTDKESAVV